MSDNNFWAQLADGSPLIINVLQGGNSSHRPRPEVRRSRLRVHGEWLTVTTNMDDETARAVLGGDNSPYCRPWSTPGGSGVRVVGQRIVDHGGDRYVVAASGDRGCGAFVLRLDPGMVPLGDIPTAPDWLDVSFGPVEHRRRVSASPQ